MELSYSDDQIRFREEVRSWIAEAMPAHIKSALTLVSISIPVVGGRLGLGTWQGIYLFEHRSLPHRREVLLHLA